MPTGLVRVADIPNRSPGSAGSARLLLVRRGGVGAAGRFSQRGANPAPYARDRHVCSTR